MDFLSEEDEQEEVSLENVRKIIVLRPIYHISDHTESGPLYFLNQVACSALQ